MICEGEVIPFRLNRFTASAKYVQDFLRFICPREFLIPSDVPGLGLDDTSLMSFSFWIKYFRHTRIEGKGSIKVIEPYPFTVQRKPMLTTFALMIDPFLRSKTVEIDRIPTLGTINPTTKTKLPKR